MPKPSLAKVIPINRKSSVSSWSLTFGMYKGVPINLVPDQYLLWVLEIPMSDWRTKHPLPHLLVYEEWLRRHPGIRLAFPPLTPFVARLKTLHRCQACRVIFEAVFTAPDRCLSCT